MTEENSLRYLNEIGSDERGKGGYTYKKKSLRCKLLRIQNNTRLNLRKQTLRQRKFLYR